MSRKFNPNIPTPADYMDSLKEFRGDSELYRAKLKESYVRMKGVVALFGAQQEAGFASQTILAYTNRTIQLLEDEAYRFGMNLTTTQNEAVTL